MILRATMPLDSSRCGACRTENGDGTTEETLLDGLAEARHFFARFLVCKQKMILPSPDYNGRKVTTAMQPMQAKLIGSCIDT